jgi:4-carboxymuconolactone decarboxylase
MAEGYASGVAAFARQFGIAEDDVRTYMTERFGERMAAEAIDAAGSAWAPDSPLSLRDRSLAVLAALIAQGGVEERLGPHVRWALEHEVTRQDIEALAAFLAVYIGYPRASVAMEVIRQELGPL